MKPSATASFSQRAQDLRARGVDVLPFGVGEPDFATPTHVLEAAKRALDDGATRYTSVRGILSLREAICRDSEILRGGIRHRPDEVVVSVGAKHSLFNLCFVLLGPGDEAVVPTPCWVSYPEQCTLAGATPVLVETREEDGFRLTPAALESALSERTRALFLCSPCNPTGAAYTREQLSGIAEIARRHRFWIVVDEIYGGLTYAGFRQHSLLEVAPDLRDRVIVVDGVSKRFAMTGFRIGWMLGPKHVAEACEVIQSQTTTSPAAVAQHAAIAALEGPKEPVEAMRQAFERRREIAVQGLNAIPGLRCREPEGAFYAFFDVRAYLGRELGGRRIDDDWALAEYLLEEAHCAFVAGSAFLAPGYLRMSYAASEAQIREGLSRLARALSR
ncbi:MAG: pyridoxal phosphate-dependent aminotransferase [Myxococcales bacterium]